MVVLQMHESCVYWPLVHLNGRALRGGEYLQRANRKSIFRLQLTTKPDQKNILIKRIGLNFQTFKSGTLLLYT
jgi:hypothetical protein